MFTTKASLVLKQVTKKQGLMQIQSMLLRHQNKHHNHHLHNNHHSAQAPPHFHHTPSEAFLKLVDEAKGRGVREITIEEL